ncbi:hypothetical protein O3M35_001878 [Rhynocoris fuscipes]|uniref:Uncharacterized protein n=1 Tax=Rhynocoris fuscipes TaxID=488301 RepID=A0AAW1CT29_9HEMI
MKMTRKTRECYEMPSRGLLDVTYRSFREAEDELVMLTSGCGPSGVIVSGTNAEDRRRSGLSRSRSESNLTTSQVSLAPLPVPNNTLHKCLRVLSGSWRNIFHNRKSE